MLDNHIVPGHYDEKDGYLFPMNTIVSLKMYYQSQLEEVATNYDKIVQDLACEVDRYHTYDDIVNLKTINDSCGTDSQLLISDNLFDLISLGIDLTKITKGAFNLAMGSLIDLYAPYFDEDSPGLTKSLPSKILIDEALLGVPSYEKIDEVIELDKQKKTIKLNKINNHNVIISLGAIAKGYVMQKAYDYLKQNNYPCIIDAGSSTMATLGNNPLRKDKNWLIGFQKPLINQDSSLLCTISTKDDTFISTSGDYRLNFFYQDENNKLKLMHHIIDSKTGVSNNYTRSVTLVSHDTNLAILDALSTALFNIENQADVAALFEVVNSKYNSNIDYLISRPYQNSFNEFELTMNKNFKDCVTTEFDDSIKKINIID